MGNETQNNKKGNPETSITETEMKAPSLSKKPKRLKLWIGVSVSVVVLAIIVFAIVWVKGIYNELDDFQKPQEESLFEQFTPVPKEELPQWTGKERVNILLLGGDARDAQEGSDVARSDSMLVASIDPVTNKIHLLSIMRDTYVKIPGYRKDRANSAIVYGGPTVAMQMAGELLGLDIQYYVYTDFEGFKALVDELGGVNFEVEKDMRYTSKFDGPEYDIDLKKGYQLLDGKKALQYVRFRHDAMSDYTRTERQRNFLSAVAKEMQSTWNILRLKDILNAVSPYVETNMTADDIIKLAQVGLRSHMAGTAQVPPMSLLREENVGGAEVLTVRNQEKLLQYIQDLLASDNTEEVAEDGEQTKQDSESGTNGASLAEPSSGKQSVEVP